MKIVVLTNLFPNKNDPMNGIFNRERVTALQRLGCEVIVIAPISYAPKLRYLFPYPKIKSIIKHIVEVYSLPKRDTYKDIDVLRVKRFALPNKLTSICLNLTGSITKALSSLSISTSILLFFAMIIGNTVSST